MDTLEKECPKGKILNKKTNRCVSIDGVIGKNILKNIKDVNAKIVTRDCPPGKIMNVKTKRCVSITGAIGKLLQKTVAENRVDKRTNTDILKNRLVNNKIASNLELVDAANFALAKRLILSTRLAMHGNKDKKSSERAIDFPFGMFFDSWPDTADFVIVNGLYKSVKYTLSFPMSIESLVYMTVHHRDEIHCLKVSNSSSTIQYACSSFTNTKNDMFSQMTTMLIEIFQDILHFKNSSKFIKAIETSCLSSKKVKNLLYIAARPKIKTFKVLKTTPKDMRGNVRIPYNYIDEHGVLFEISEDIFAKFDFSVEAEDEKDIKISLINFENQPEIILNFHTETNKFAEISRTYAIKDLTRDWKKTYEIAMAYKNYLKSAKSNGNINQKFHDANWDLITLDPYCIRLFG
jgi:hypothetical protein